MKKSERIRTGIKKTITPSGNSKSGTKVVGKQYQKEMVDHQADVKSILSPYWAWRMAS